MWKRDLVVCHRPLFDGVKTTATNLAVCSWALVLCVCPWQGNQTIKQNALQNKSHCSLSSSFCSALALLCLQQHTHAQLTAQGKRKTVRDHTNIMGTTGLRCAVLVITSLVWPQTLFFPPSVDPCYPISWPEVHQPADLTCYTNQLTRGKCKIIKNREPKRELK